MMTSRRFFGLAMMACYAFTGLPMKLIDLAIATYREFEDHAVAWSRFELTLAHWRKVDQAVDEVLRADMRASGHGAVFNDMPSHLTMRQAI